jgi:hypothetical protein
MGKHSDEWTENRPGPKGSHETLQIKSNQSEQYENVWEYFMSKMLSLHPS